LKLESVTFFSIAGVDFLDVFFVTFLGYLADSASSYSSSSMILEVVCLIPAQFI
jgi:hypothetical protein